nr:MAG TPA: hypothetical protein [Bacteriophage sp.]
MRKWAFIILKIIPSRRGFKNTGRIGRGRRSRAFISETSFKSGA